MRAVTVIVALFAKLGLPGSCKRKNDATLRPELGLGPSGPLPPPPVPPLPPTPSRFSRTRFNSNFETARATARRKRRCHQRSSDSYDSARRVLLDWSDTESESPSVASQSDHARPSSGSGFRRGRLLQEFTITDEVGTWEFDMYSSNNTGGATFVVRLNGMPVTGTFGSYDKASFSHDLHQCKNERVKLDRLQLPRHCRYRGLGPKILYHLLRLYKNAGALAVTVPSPSNPGRKCYKKFGFRKNLMNTLEMDLKEWKPIPPGEAESTQSEDVADVVEDQDLNGLSERDHEPELGVDDLSGSSEYVRDDDASSLESSGNVSDATVIEPMSESGDDAASTTRLSRTRARGVATAGYTVPITSLVRRSSSMNSVVSQLNESSLCSLNDENWNVEKCTNVRGGTTGYVSLRDIHADKSYEVVPSRVPKAKLNLSYDACMAAMKTDACGCRKKCNRRILDPVKIADLRSPIYTCATEQDVNIHLTEKIKANGGNLLIPVDGEMHKVCPKYYARVYSVCLHRVKHAAKLARRNKCAPSKKRKRGADTATESVKKNIAYSFWAIFFEQNCQRPNNEVRIFPVAKSYNLIYKEYFTPWFARLVEKGAYDCSQKPSFSTFLRARRHEDFDDVKERAKHNHARCAECAILKHLVLEGFKNGAAEEEYIQRRRLHDTEVLKWRELESTYKALAVSDPSKVLVVMHDGTEALGLPRLTNRTLKNLSPARFEVVPWLGEDLSAQRKDYIYTAKSAFPKDSNTLISQIHSMIRRAKSDYEHPRHKARKLVLIADSASENKNNTLFAYITDLVDNKWFDEVELVFGPVGHTHNGVDACHKIHNQNVGGCASADIGHFVHNYPKGYSGQHTTVPHASFLSRSVDWIKYYEPCVRKISGFTKTKNDPHMVRGFRIARQRDNTVSLTWKMDPGSEKEWRGADGFGGTLGFYMLKSTPTGLPDFVPHPETTLEEKTALRKLRSLNMQKAMDAHGLSHESMRYNHVCAAEKSILPNEYLELEAPAGEWGRACRVGGTDGARGVLREIKYFWDPNLPAERSSLWSLPVGANGEHNSATNIEHSYSCDQQLLDSRRLAQIRYEDERSQVVHHPNNAAPSGDRSGSGWVLDEEENYDGGLEGGGSGGRRLEAAGVAQSEASRAWRFEEDFSKCQVGKFCIGLNEASVGPSPYLFVGKITSVNLDDKTFEYKRYRSTVDPWTEACLAKPWHTHSKDGTDRNPHHSVIAYFKNLKQNKQIPKAAANAVQSRNISWPSS